MKLVECVPNISEGRNPEIYEAVAAAAASVPGVTLLNIDPGADTNRTVITFVGNPEAVAEGAFQLIRKGCELIDMSKHRGAHPRIGAVDVVPFVPVSEMTMDECVDLARRLGKRVGEELSIPVYLYEFAASAPHRRNLADIREGEYEGLAKKIVHHDWKPDFGPAKFNPRCGATVIGARKFLVAYNVNLNTMDKRLATRVAFDVRERGRMKRDADGQPILDKNGEPLWEPGLLKSVKAVGWVIPSTSALKSRSTSPISTSRRCMSRSTRAKSAHASAACASQVPRLSASYRCRFCSTQDGTTCAAWDGRRAFRTRR